MGLGSFLRRVTTIPSHGVLSPLRKVFGKTPLDELGAGVGFVLGGPLGAGAGAGLGSLVHGAPVSAALGNAAKFGAAGLGANAALGYAGGGVQGALGELRPVTGGIGRLLGVGSQIPGAGTDTAGTPQTHAGGLGGILNWLTDPKAGENRLRLLGTALSAGGGLVQGNAEDRQATATNTLNRGGLDLQRQAENFQEQQALAAQQRRAQYDPQRQAILSAILAKIGGGQAAHA